MGWAALLLAVVTLITTILDARRSSAPRRRREALEEAYGTDVDRANHAIAAGRPEQLDVLFEAERQAAITAGCLDPRGGDPAAELREQPAAGGDRSRPDDQPPA